MSGHGAPHDSHGLDSTGKKVGILAALLAIGLTMVTIAPHRTPTAGIVARSEANDLWAYFQSKRIKTHTLELGIDLIGAQGLKGEAADKFLEKYKSEKERQIEESKEIKAKADEKEHE